ncbi:MetQ/NlpA family ABC transporter substrate-binding protein [Paratissierella segnis]|mgnify:FL=1|jgi:D-methionine transport system substrate-binding protein|uniref:Lipoprotein n=1 Tax=Paratissierella segnis TaxID=2763679 RepID=A0A926ESM3_9FIRM|nr:MetQ/NlpA family ABC transporter substrate-binding protein [Paratissierella segnis]MBC8586911.1 MetQ/NlpA family ABC transporter substrate-binding protein [Paratissierella segnis]
MKKIFSILIISILSLSLLAGYSEKSEKDNEIIIGVSPEPHEKLISLVIDDLKKEGIEVKTVTFTDYVQPNIALNDGELDANFFQHLPYLEDFVAKQNVKLISLGSVHVEPMALYSNKYNSLDEIPNNAEIVVPNDSVNGGRALILLEHNGLIKLKEGAGLSATEKDIVENPKNIKITALEAAGLPRVLDDVDGAVINGNYALEAGLNPVNDGLIIEDKDSPYANIVAVREGEENQEKFQKLLKALQSDKVRKFIEENYDGGVVPAF